MLVRREALEDVGLLDEGYWLYMEDLDWCYRFHQKGWKVWYDGAVTVHAREGRDHEAQAPSRAIAPQPTSPFTARWAASTGSSTPVGRPLVDGAIYAAILAKLAVAITRSTIARRSLA